MSDEHKGNGMKRKVVLSKRASLWEAGDAARSIGVLESGRLGVMTDRGLVGVVLPGMIVGEGAVFTLAGEKHTRTASVFALDDQTTVAEYSIFLVKQAIDDGRYDFAQELLLGLIVQACRNFELTISANEHRPLIAPSIRSTAVVPPTEIETQTLLFQGFAKSNCVADRESFQGDSAPQTQLILRRLWRIANTSQPSSPKISQNQSYDPALPLTIESQSGCFRRILTETCLSNGPRPF